MHPEILATKLLLRQKINGIPTNILKLNCNGAVIVDSVQHYAHLVQCSPEDFLGPGARDCSVMYHRKSTLYCTMIMFYPLHESGGQSRMRSGIFAVDIHQMD